jgi:hypothetical protein
MEVLLVIGPTSKASKIHSEMKPADAGHAGSAHVDAAAGGARADTFANDPS